MALACPSKRTLPDPGYQNEVTRNIGERYCFPRREQKYLHPERAWLRSYQSAVVLGKLGENDRAIEQLYEAYKIHDRSLTQLKVEAAFDNLRSDARFIDLLHRMNLD